MDNKIIQSYIGNYFISTINRDSSCADYPYQYAETIVFNWDKKTRNTGGIAFMDSSIKDSYKKHFEICIRILETGSPEEAESES